MRITTLTIPLAMIWLCIQCYQAEAQEAPKDSVKAKKPWLLTLGIDIKCKNLGGFLNNYYQGEYFGYGGMPYYSWQTISTKQKIKIGEYKLRDVKLDMLIGRNRNFSFGVSYNIGNVTKIKNGLIFQPFYLGISGLAQYRYYFAKGANADGYFYGSLAVGSYQADAEISGPGMQLFTQSHLGIGYEIMQGFRMNLYAGTDYLLYRDKMESPIYHKTQTIKTDVNLYYIGIGISGTFHLTPD